MHKIRNRKNHYFVFLVLVLFWKTNEQMIHGFCCIISHAIIWTKGLTKSLQWYYLCLSSRVASIPKRVWLNHSTGFPGDSTASLLLSWLPHDCHMSSLWTAQVNKIALVRPPPIQDIIAEFEFFPPPEKKFDIWLLKVCLSEKFYGSPHKDNDTWDRWVIILSITPVSYSWMVNVLTENIRH